MMPFCSWGMLYNTNAIEAAATTTTTTTRNADYESRHQLSIFWKTFKATFLFSFVLIIDQYETVILTSEDFFVKSFYYFYKWAIPGLFFFILVFSMIVNTICRWLDSNRKCLVAKATSLSTEPQPIAPVNHLFKHNSYGHLIRSFTHLQTV